MAKNQSICDIGFIGLGVMGKNLVLNLADNGYQVAGFDLDSAKVDAILQQDTAERIDDIPRVLGCHSLSEVLQNTLSPRVIFLSVPAGDPVDQVARHLIEAGIEKQDIVIDTGNSLWTDSVERAKQYQQYFSFFSTAVSGGEVGARFGPSLMPSGDRQAWQVVEPILKAISAKVDPNTGKPLDNYAAGKPITEGEPCATYIGPLGAGHYVKMVHNGIEYADMQLICEAYQMMSDGLAMSASEIAQVLRKWNRGPLDSYLIEISADVLDQVDGKTNKPLVEMILDKAGQKGTGLWTAVSALQVGSPAQTITQAVFARSLSSLKSQRVKAAKVLSGPTIQQYDESQKLEIIQSLHDALYCSKICAYAQGFQLMDVAAKEYGWQLNFAEIAKIWRAGCIIRAAFLTSITQAYQHDSELENLLMAPFFTEQITRLQANWRSAIANATMQGIPCAAMSSALNYYDSYRCEVLPANLLQGQRDYFGAHAYHRTDDSSAQKYHTNWSEAGRKEVKI